MSGPAVAAMLQWNRGLGLEPHQGVALEGSPLFYHFGECRIPRLVAVTFTFQFNARGVPIIFARPADA